MDWPEYKALCDRPDVCSRWMLDRTLALLDAEPVAAALRRILASAPLPKPADHVGPPDADMFVGDLDAALVHAALAAVLEALAAGRLAAVLGRRSQAGFVAAWREYAEFVEAREAGPDPAAG